MYKQKEKYRMREKRAREKLRTEEGFKEKMSRESWLHFCVIV